MVFTANITNFKQIKATLWSTYFIGIFSNVFELTPTTELLDFIEERSIKYSKENMFFGITIGNTEKPIKNQMMFGIVEDN